MRLLYEYTELYTGKYNVTHVVWRVANSDVLLKVQAGNNYSVVDRNLMWVLLLNIIDILNLFLN